jgi:hypothetical protein
MLLVCDPGVCSTASAKSSTSSASQPFELELSIVVPLLLQSFQVGLQAANIALRRIGLSSVYIVILKELINN